MQRICVDMDEVMADTLAEHLRRYNQAFDEAVTPEDLAGKGLWEIAPQDRQAELRAFLDAEDFFEVLDVIPGAEPVLKDLSSRFEIFIATQAMAVPNSLGPKYRWLQRHFSFIPPTHYVFCGNKSILRADYLIDDQPRNLTALRRPGAALHRAAQPHRDRLCAREQLARSGGLLCRNPFRIPNSGLIAQSSRNGSSPNPSPRPVCKPPVRYHEI